MQHCRISGHLVFYRRYCLWRLDFRQCANDDQIGSKNDGIIDQCEWITGAITQNNSDYAESDGVPQRYIFTDPGTGSDCHTVVFRYDFTKSDVYTYDFMVDPDHTVPSSLLNHCGNLPLLQTLRRVKMP